MADPGQHENLTEILGFDPNASTEPRGIGDGTPKPKSERYGWPKDWKQLFQDEMVGKGRNRLVYQDAERLFAISTFPAGKVIIERSYYSYDPEAEGFRAVSGATFSDDKFTLSARADNDSHYSLTYDEKALVPIRVGEKIGGRMLDIHYLGNGQLHGVEWASHSLEGDGSSPMKKTNVYYSPENGFEFSKKDGVELDISVSETGTGILKRLENSEVLDILEVPLTLSLDKINKIKDSVPDELLRHPDNPNTKLDEGWRGVDFFHELGLKWDPVADDSLHSLTPIPVPAPTD